MNIVRIQEISCAFVRRALWLCFTAVAVMLVATVPLKAYAVTNTVSIPVEQIFGIAPGLQNGGTFSYVFERTTTAAPLPAGAVGDRYHFTLSGNQTRSIGPLNFNHAGFFTYEVRAEASQRSGYVLDGTVFVVTISVRNYNGGLVAEIGSIYAHSVNNPSEPVVTESKVDGIVFEMSYYGVLAGSPGSLLNPAIVKTVQGNPATPYTFTFRLEASADNHPMPVGATGRVAELTITGSGRNYFAPWTHTHAGEFSWTIREIPTNNNDWIFDSMVYTITDSVTLVNDEITVNRIVTNSDNRQVISLSFINTYIGSTIAVQEAPPGGGAGAGTGAGGPVDTTNRPIVGPQTGDYADPFYILITMIGSALVAVVALLLIYIDKRSEEEHGDLHVASSAYSNWI